MTGDGAELPPTGRALQLDVRANLLVDADGVPVHVTGAGGDLRVHAADAAGLASALVHARRAAGGPASASLAALTRNLNDVGLSVTLVGERGTVATIGHGQRSTVTRLLTGTPFVRPGRVDIVATTAWRVVRRSRAWRVVRRWAGVSMSVLAVCLAVAARRPELDRSTSVN